MIDVYGTDSDMTHDSLVMAVRDWFYALPAPQLIQTANDYGIHTVGDSDNWDTFGRGALAQILNDNNA